MHSLPRNPRCQFVDDVLEAPGLCDDRFELFFRKSRRSLAELAVGGPRALQRPPLLARQVTPDMQLRLDLLAHLPEGQNEASILAVASFVMPTSFAVQVPRRTP